MRDDPLSLLWLIDLEPRVGLQHGGALRWFNFSRELLARGHSVCFSVNQNGPDDMEEKRAFLEDLQRSKHVTTQAETHYRIPRRLGKLAHMLAYPRFTNVVLRRFQDRAHAAVEAIVASRKVDAVIVSDRRLLFLAPRLRGRVPIVVDWTDSMTLYEWRQSLVHWRERQLRRLPGTLKRLAQAFLQERYYGRRSSANVLVSPVDLKALSRTTGRAGLGRLLLNGIAAAEAGDRTHKVPGRIVFTGAMNFPPNFQAAVWFIDYVLPLVWERRPETCFVVAGRDPVPELRRRVGPHVVVTGAVADIRQEIAKSALYVAPLVSGGGFKNKVIEAIAAGTFVAGTSMALEFLPEALREPLLVGDSASELAGQVLSFLDNPAEFDRRLPALRIALAKEYTWSRRTEELLQIVDDVIGQARA